MRDAAADRFRHDTLLYSSAEEYLAGLVPFAAEGLAAGEPVLMVLAADKIAAVRDALGDDRDRVRFADMAAVGRNPARIIPAWAAFLAEAAPGGGPVRGVGEPVWAARSAPELAEAQLHEALLNTAFAGRSGFWLRCPYDVTTLSPEVVAAAERSHPPTVDGVPVTLDRALPEPPDVAAEMDYDQSTLPVVRNAVREHGERGGLDSTQVRHLVLAVHEAAANSVRHGGGRGSLRIWRDPDAVVCEIRDAGVISDPLIGRIRPSARAGGGRGIWIINQLCDLVQLRSSAAGTVLRMHQRPA
jgi:anti-sigma regulatory factor (Ser/Thr protein kinase)